MQMNDSGLDNCPLNVTIAFKNYVQFVTYQHKSSVIARIKERERERKKKKQGGKNKKKRTHKMLCILHACFGEKNKPFSPPRTRRQNKIVTADHFAPEF